MKVDVEGCTVLIRLCSVMDRKAAAEFFDSNLKNWKILVLNLYWRYDDTKSITLSALAITWLKINYLTTNSANTSVVCNAKTHHSFT